MSFLEVVTWVLVAASVTLNTIIWQRQRRINRALTAKPSCPGHEYGEPVVIHGTTPDGGLSLTVRDTPFDDGIWSTYQTQHTLDLVGGPHAQPSHVELDGAIEQIVSDYIPDSLLRIQLAKRVLAEVVKRTGLDPFAQPKEAP